MMKQSPPVLSEISMMFDVKLIILLNKSMLCCKYIGVLGVGLE